MKYQVQSKLPNEKDWRLLVWNGHKEYDEIAGAIWTFEHSISLPRMGTKDHRIVASNEDVVRIYSALMGRVCQNSDYELLNSRIDTLAEQKWKEAGCPESSFWHVAKDVILTEQPFWVEKHGQK